MKRVELICTKDIDDNFKKDWKNTLAKGIFPTNFMKKGWKTWATWNDFKYSGEETILLEDNKYRINFPIENLKEI